MRTWSQDAWHDVRLGVRGFRRERAFSVSVVAIVVGSGLALAAGGIVVGFGLALVAAPFVEPLLFRTSPRNPAVFAGVAVMLLAMAVLATVLPATRARRVNPVEAMRTE